MTCQLLLQNLPDQGRHGCALLRGDDAQTFEQIVGQRNGGALHAIMMTQVMIRRQPPQGSWMELRWMPPHENTWLQANTERMIG